MFKFFRKKPENVIPEISVLEHSPLRNKYCLRNTEWFWQDSRMIWVKDPLRPGMITMGPWERRVFLNADGTKTVEELVRHLAAQSGPKEPLPEKFEEMILEIIVDFAERSRVIKLADEVSELPASFLHPALA